MMSDAIRRLLGRDEGGALPPPRLTEAEARRIADAAASGLPLADGLVAQGRAIKDGRIVWAFWTPTLGSSLSVDVDDATGEADVTQVHGR